MPRLASMFLVQADITAAITRDCTSSGCASGSLGQSLLDTFDADHDGTVTVTEVRTNSLVEPFFALDLDLDGDGTKDALSAGIHSVIDVTTSRSAALLRLAARRARPGRTARAPLATA